MCNSNKKVSSSTCRCLLETSGTSGNGCQGKQVHGESHLHKVGMKTGQQSKLPALPHTAPRQTVSGNTPCSVVKVLGKATLGLVCSEMPFELWFSPYLTVLDLLFQVKLLIQFYMKQ